MTERKDKDQSHLEGREEINNVWDKDPELDKARDILASEEDESLLELSYTGISLLTSEDPYQVKTGIQILRLCLSRNETVVDFWMKNQASRLMQHEHPRVRHSALWNVRTALWFNNEHVDCTPEFGH